MLNMGFADAVEKILGAIKSKDKFQFVLFSATVPKWVKDVASKWMSPKHHTINLVGEKTAQTATLVEHLCICCSVPQRQETIGDVVKVYGRDGSCIIFVDTKAEANDLAVNSTLSEMCQVLHGDIVQSQRELTLAGFRQRKFKVLVATDVAARGLDISGVDLVIHIRPPRDRDTFIHRSGRTGRAGERMGFADICFLRLDFNFRPLGRSGTSIVFCTQSELRELKRIEQQCGVRFKRVGPPQLSEKVTSAADVAKERIVKVDDSNIDLFRKHAEELIEKMGALKAVAASLSYLSGYSDRMEVRSLLASLIGYKTILIRAATPIHSPRYVLNFLSRFDEKLPVKMIRLCQDGSAVADLPEGLADQIVGKHGPVEIAIPESLPELADDPRESMARSSSFSDRRGSGGGAGGRRGSERRGGGRGSSRGGNYSRRGSSAFT